MILLLAALLSFQPYDSGLPRSGQWRHGFAVADMNQDGLPDLVFSPARKQAGPPVIFLNERNGQWRQWTEATFPAIPFDYGAVAVADFDGNGANDITIASHYRGVTAVLGDGKGKFIAGGEGMLFPATPRESAPFSSRAILVTDWNGDGRIDVAALSDGPRPGVSGVQLGITIWQNLGTWQPKRAVKTDKLFGDAIAAGDVDGDGLADLLTASHTNSDRRILRLGSDVELEPREVQTLHPTLLIRGVELHDFDGDGRDEIVAGYLAATSPRRGSLELLAYPNGSRAPRQLWSEEGADVAGVAVGDVNGDGFADLIAALDDGRLLAFRGNSTGGVIADAVIATPEWRRGCTPYAVRVADLDGDRRDEVIAAFAGESNGCATAGGIEVWRTTVSSESSKRRRSVRH